MKKLLIKILLFILPLVLFAYGLDKLFSEILKKSNSFADGEFSVWNTLYEGGINSELVIYGSSRAYRHIDPVIFGNGLNKSAYNLGVNGHSFKTEYFRHILLLKYNKKPDLIIQTLDVTTFDKYSDLYNPDQFLPYMLNNNEMERSVSNGFKPIDYRFPMIRFYGKKEAFIEIIKLIIAPGSNEPYRSKGYKSRDESWTDDLLLAQEKMGTLEVNSDPGLIALFERYLVECREQKIPLVFVYTPEYIEGQRFVKNRAEILDVYYGLSRKYDIPFIDYSNDSLSYNTEYFFNSGHLNKTGAELFTHKLIDTLKSSNPGSSLFSH